MEFSAFSAGKNRREKRVTGRRVLKIAIPLLILVTIAGYNNCGQTKFVSTVQETVITNPKSPIANEVMFAVCGVINRCDPQITIDKCQSGLLNTNGFETPLGLSAN